AAALLILASPGMRFLHEGQLSGARNKIPVQLIRRLPEPIQPDIETFYEQILTTLPATEIGQGTGKFLHPRPAWPGNLSAQSIVLVQWQSKPPAFDLVVVNLAPNSSQCYAPLTVENLSAHHWSMKDLLGHDA